jgi:hypothetical protein
MLLSRGGPPAVYAGKGSGKKKKSTHSSRRETIHDHLGKTGDNVGRFAADGA